MANVTYEGGAWTAGAPMATTRPTGRSWAQVSGREDGKDGYQFGDMTRSLAGLLRGKKGRGWQDAAGRSSGGDAYRFGDLTRVALSNLFGDRHRMQGSEGGGMGVMPTVEPLFPSVASVGGLAAAGDVLAELWLAFLNASYAVGRLALGAGELSVEAIEDSEPSVLLGLPSLATLECAIRSAPHAASGDLTAFDGQRINFRRAGVAVPSEVLALFDSMLELSRRVATSCLSACGLASLRARALAVSATAAGAGGALSEAEEQEINQLVALSQSVATRVSQMPTYKSQFMKVLDALSDAARHDADMMHMMSQLA